MDNGYLLLKIVLEETANGHRLRTKTRMEIERHVKAVEKNRDFMFEVMTKKRGGGRMTEPKRREK